MNGFHVFLLSSSKEEEDSRKLFKYVHRLFLFMSDKDRHCTESTILSVGDIVGCTDFLERMSVFLARK